MNTVDTVIWDADNTLWDWMSYAVPAYEAMCNAIAVYAGVHPDQTAAAMKAFYTLKGTIEDEGLVQGLLAAGFFSHMSNFDLNQAVHIAKIAFSQEREKYLNLYPGVFKAVTEVRKRVKQQFVLTDATGEQAPRRLMRSGLSSQFNAIYSMERPLVENIPENLRRPRSGGIGIPHHILKEEKPHITLEALLGMTREEIAARVAIIGDNDAKDMELARRYGCIGIHAAYGRVPDPNLIPRLLRFAPPAAARKNMQIIGKSEPKDNPRILTANHASEIPGLLLAA